MAPRKQKQDWDVRTNIGASPGSQGTLFSGGKSQMSDQRYPRGYTPERQAAAREAVQGHTWSDHRPEQQQDANNQRRQIADTVARSTMPLHHLSNVQFAHVPSGSRILGEGGLGQSGGRNDDAGGAYFAARGHRGSALIAVQPDLTRTSTVLHEIGHHVSHTSETPAHGGEYSYQTEHGGAEEAFADNYAQEHFRNKQGKPETKGIYGGGQFAGRIQRGDEFWTNYHKNRTYLPDADAHARNEQFLKDYPEERTHADGSMDVPLINKSYVSRDDMKKHGEKPELDINWDAEPDNPKYY